MLHKKRQPARIEEIIELVRQQEPGRHDTIKALKKCTGENGRVVATMSFQLPGW